MKSSIFIRKGCSAVIGLVLLIGGLLGCSMTSSNSTPIVDGIADTSKYVKLSMYLLGPSSTESIMSYQDTVEELNISLKENINANVEITFIPFDEVETQYPLIFNSKESYDMIFTSASGRPSYFHLAAQEAFKPLDELLPLYAADIWEKTSTDTWEDIRYEGKIYGVPFGVAKYRANGYIYRGDLLQKYGMEPILSMEDMELYMDTLLGNEEAITPIGINEEDAVKLYDMMVDLNSAWIPAPGLPQSNLYLVARSKDNITDIVHPAFSNDFMEFAERMKDWADKGYWFEDILTINNDVMDGLSSEKNASLFGDLGRYINGLAGLSNHKGWTESQLKFWCFSESNQKVIKASAAENAIGFSEKANNPERALMLLDLIFKEKDSCGLLNYGIQGEILGYVGSAHMVKHYEDIAIKDPYSKFAFDSTSVDSEIEKVLRVNSQIGIPILLGKAGDPRTAVNAYREALKDADIQKVIDELKEQLKGF